MIETLVALLPGGTVAAVLGAVAGVAVALFGAWRSGRRAERDRQRAREAEVYEQEIDRLRRAGRARAESGRGELYEDDGYRRD